MKDLLGQPKGSEFSGNTPGGPQGDISPTMSASQGEGKSFDILDLKQYFHIVVKRIWLVALCFVIALAVMVVMLVRQVPAYSAQTTLLLSKGLPLPQRLSQQEIKGIGGDYLATQQRIIKSPVVLQRARERLARPATEIVGKIKSVDVYTVPRTSIMAVRVQSLDPILAAEFANAIAEEYLDFKAEERMDTSQATVLSLTQQANRIREELTRAEERLLAFEKENSIVGIQERGNIAGKYLAKLSNEAAGYRTKLMMLEAQQPLLKEASDEAVLQALAVPGGLALAARPTITSFSRTNASTNDSPLVAEGPEALIDRGLVQSGGWAGLKMKKALLEAKLASLRKRFRDAHPDIRAVLQDLEGVGQSLDVELQFALGQYYSELEALRIKEQAVYRVQKDWEEEAIQDARTGHEYRNLQRNVERLRGLYDLVFNRLKEVDISIGIEPESIRIMERANPPSSPMSPRKMQSIFMAALVGLGIGLGLVFGLEFIDDSLRYPEEVTNGLKLNFFGVIPAANWDPDDLRSHMLSNIDQKSGLSEAYRNVRSSLLYSTKNYNARTIVVTSAVPKEGKTTTCLNLAVSLAQAGSRILIVDGDLRRGELHKFFGLEGGRGFSDVLVGQAKPESVIQRTGIPNLDLIATGPFPPNPAEIMLRPELSAFMDYAKSSYDYVLFDCPPVMAVSEAAILASSVEAVTFVVWAGQTSRKLSGLAVQVLRERGANILGCVLNNLEFARVGYYYYSTYYGYYDYDYRYESGEPDSRDVS